MEIESLLSKKNFIEVQNYLHAHDIAGYRKIIFDEKYDNDNFVLLLRIQKCNTVNEAKIIFDKLVPTEYKTYALGEMALLYHLQNDEKNMIKYSRMTFDSDPNNMYSMHIYGSMLGAYYKKYDLAIKYLSEAFKLGYLPSIKQLAFGCTIEYCLNRTHALEALSYACQCSILLNKGDAFKCITRIMKINSKNFIKHFKEHTNSSSKNPKFSPELVIPHDNKSIDNMIKDKQYHNLRTLLMSHNTSTREYIINQLNLLDDQENSFVLGLKMYYNRHNKISNDALYKKINDNDFAECEWLYHQLWEHKCSAEHKNRISELAKKNVLYAHDLLGLIEEQNGNYEMAIEHYKHAIQIYPTHTSYYNISACYKELYLRSDNCQNYGVLTLCYSAIAYILCEDESLLKRIDALIQSCPELFIEYYKKYLPRTEIERKKTQRAEPIFIEI